MYKRKRAAFARQDRKIAKRRRTAPLVRRIASATDIKTTVFAFNNTVTTGTSFVTNLLGNLTRGTNYINNFIGNKIDIVSLTIRWAIVSGDPTNIVRWSITQFVNSAPINTTAVYQVAGNPLSSFALDDWQDYNVIVDQMTCYFQRVATQNDIQCGKEYRKGKKFLPVSFNSAGAITGGGIYLTAVADSNILPNPSLQFVVEIRYKDS